MMMPISIKTDDVPLQQWADGTIRIAGTRVLLDIVIGEYKDGKTPQQIVDSYDILTLADVYSAIGYYLRHKTEIEAYLKKQEEAADEVRKEVETGTNYQRLRDKFLSFKQELNEGK